MNVNVLETRGLTKRFGGLTAVDNVSFQVAKGELRSVIGPNGAGKTTFFNLIAGRLPPTEGEIWFKGENITRIPPYQITKKGIGRSYQVTNIFPRLTVFENVRLAAQAVEVTFNFWKNVMSMDETNRNVLEILERLQLVDLKDILAENLPHGMQRHLEIAVAMASDPELLLLDEPTAGMTQDETERMMALINEISEGLTIILVEHDMKFVMSVSKKITVLHEGKVLAEGSPEEIRNNEDVQSVYLGKQA
ncbi:MAG: ABC transporter ATP-binding protein [Deltaproteobacteria bacterium]|nr:ABC transporter ATP-binding protein [Deltaproteobacteria bacterium]